MILIETARYIFGERQQLQYVISKIKSDETYDLTSFI